MNDVSFLLIQQQSITRHKTAAIIGTVTSVPGYPKKLKIYLNNASPYWQAVYWDRGKTYRRSLKTTDKRTAYEHAKQFYEQLILAKYQHPVHLQNHIITAVNLPTKHTQPEANFKWVATQWISRQAVKWTPRHRLMVEKRLQTNIYKYVAHKNIQRITRWELLELIQKIEARGACDVARRVLNDCRRIWQFAIVIGLCKQDITIGLNATLHGHVVVHQKAVMIEDFPELMLDISKYNKQSDQITRYALQLIALTFVRKNELLLAKWQEFDLENALWKVPAERMKMRIAHVVPLSTHAIAILNYIRQMYPSDQYIFHNGNPTSPIRDNALIQALYYMGYKTKMTVHGFRAIASTILNEQGFRSDVIERQLAHAEPNQVRRAYNRAQYMSERIEMMSWWSDYLNGITPFVTVNKQ
jgi:integrase